MQRRRCRETEFEKEKSIFDFWKSEKLSRSLQAYKNPRPDRILHHSIIRTRAGNTTTTTNNLPSLYTALLRPVKMPSQEIFFRMPASPDSPSSTTVFFAFPDGECNKIAKMARLRQKMHPLLVEHIQPTPWALVGFVKEGCAESEVEEILSRLHTLFWRAYKDLPSINCAFTFVSRTVPRENMSMDSGILAQTETVSDPELRQMSAAGDGLLPKESNYGNLRTLEHRLASISPCLTPTCFQLESEYGKDLDDGFQRGLPIVDGEDLAMFKADQRQAKGKL